MAAVISTITKFQQAEKLFNDVGQQYVVLNDSATASNFGLADSAQQNFKGLGNLTGPHVVKKHEFNRVYAGIARSEDWNANDSAPAPGLNPRTVRTAQYTLQGLKQVNDYKFVVPRYNWTSGATYSAYDDNQTGYPSNAYYVLTDENNVYICLQRAKNASGTAQPSTIKPSGVATSAFSTADGYVWKFLYSIDATNANKYLASNYMPVEKVVADSANDPVLSAAQTQQVGVQNAAVDGAILNIELDSGGAGYVNAPAITVVGNGSGATAHAYVSGGVIKKIAFDSASFFGSGYTYASITIADSSGVTKPAVARPVIGPSGGIGADPRQDLKSSSIMFNTQPAGVEGGEFPLNDFRQVLLVKNPLNWKYDSARDYYTGSVGSTLRRLTVTGSNDQFDNDDTITQSATGAKALVDSADATYIYYHQNETTGFTAFDSSAITSSPGGGSATVIQLGDSADATEIDRMTGDVLYIDNRAAVARSAAQTEDLKIVITI
jgi:hypothetical protein